MRFLYSIICSLSIAALGAVGSAEAADIDFTYATPDSKPATPIGTGKKNMHYDVAIHLNNPALTGYQVVGINVPIPATGGECYPEASAWLASALTLQDEIFHPDIASADGTIVNYGTEEAPDFQLRINFDQPYTLTAEGVYVGYTVMVKDLKQWTSKYPVSVVEGVNAPGSLWIHCPKVDNAMNVRYLVWTDAYTSQNISSAMTVTLRGPRGEFMASPTAGAKVAVETGKTTTLPVIITNYGTEPVNSISYAISNPATDRVPYIGTYTFASPIPAVFGASAAAELTIPSEPEQSDCSMHISIDKVNGQTNISKDSWSAFRLITRDRLPVRRPLIEEYTGTWCKYCPEAYVTLKQLRDTYSHNEAPAIVVHTSDDMTTIQPSPFPSGTSTPALIIDRVNNVYNFNNFRSEWEARQRDLCPVDIKVDLYWDDEQKTVLHPVTTVNFAFTEPDTEYLITYALVEDDMSDPSWEQASDYTNFRSNEGPYWDIFSTGPYVRGVVYDDTALAMPALNGMPDSLPPDIQPDTDYSHEALLYPYDCVNVYVGGKSYGKLVMRNPDKLRVIASVTNPATREVFNSASSVYAAQAPLYNITGVDCPDNIVSTPVLTEYYSLAGVKLAAAPAGEPYIAVIHYADGSVKSAKYLQ